MLLQPRLLFVSAQSDELLLLQQGLDDRMSPFEVLLSEQQGEPKERLAEEGFPLDQLLDDLLQGVDLAALQELLEQGKLSDEDHFGGLAMHHGEAGRFKQQGESFR